MKALERVVGGVLREFEEIPAAGLADLLKECRRQINRLEAGFARGTVRFDANHEYAADGAASTVSWLKANTQMSGGAAFERLHIGRRMNQLPHIAHAFAEGNVGYQNVGLIARTADQLGADVVRNQEMTLLDAAKELDPNRFSQVTRKLREAADPDGSLKDANRAYDERYLNLSQTLDGIYFMDGRLDPESGAIVKTALDSLMMPMSEDDRDGPQRRCDALVEMARRQMQGGSLPQVHGVKPHLTVTVSAAALAGVHGAEAGEVRGIGPVHSESVRRLACDASLSVVAMDDRGEPLDAGRTTRTIPPAMLRALAVRDGGCRWPGCDRPIEWTDGHHRHHWALGGDTKLNNLVLLCRHHHRKVHEGRWQLSRENDGTFSARGPDGRVIGAPAARSA